MLCKGCYEKLPRESKKLDTLRGKKELGQEQVPSQNAPGSKQLWEDWPEHPPADTFLLALGFSRYLRSVRSVAIGP